MAPTTTDYAHVHYSCDPATRGTVSHTLIPVSLNTHHNTTELRTSRPRLLVPSSSPQARITTSLLRLGQAICAIIKVHSLLVIPPARSLRRASGTRHPAFLQQRISPPHIRFQIARDKACRAHVWLSIQTSVSTVPRLSTSARRGARDWYSARMVGTSDRRHQERSTRRIVNTSRWPRDHRIVVLVSPLDRHGLGKLEKSGNVPWEPPRRVCKMRT